MSINVFSFYYIDQNVERNKELELCFYKNLTNPYINFRLIKNNSRMMYSDFIKLINKTTSEYDINIITNSDIYFNDTVQLFDKMQRNQSFALSRWDLQPNGDLNHYARCDSQDVWAFRGPVKNNLEADFYLGYRGCDNRFAYEIKKAGYEVSNPSRSIQTIHVHMSNIRYYSIQNNDHMIPGPYLTLEPISL